MGVAADGQIVEDGAELEREREDLLDREPVAPLERREARTVEKLEDEVGPVSAEHGVEAAHERRVGKPSERLGLAREPCEGPGVPHLGGPNDLGHDEGVNGIVPGEIRLVPPTSPRSLTACRPSARRSPSAKSQLSVSQPACSLMPSWYPRAVRPE